MSTAMFDVLAFGCIIIHVLMGYAINFLNIGDHIRFSVCIQPQSGSLDFYFIDET